MLVWLIGQSLTFQTEFCLHNNFRVDKYFSVLILLNLLIQFIQLILYASPKYFESYLQLHTLMDLFNIQLSQIILIGFGKN